MEKRNLREVTDDFKANDPSSAHRYFINKMMFTTGPVELSSALSKGAPITVVDVRERKDYEKAHVPGAICLPKEAWDSLEGLAKDRVNVIYCYSQVCHLAARACALLAEKGYPVMEMDGGFKAWTEHRLPTEGKFARAA